MTYLTEKCVEIKHISIGWEHDCVTIEVHKEMNIHPINLKGVIEYRN
jgi:hypothetical protein